MIQATTSNSTGTPKGKLLIIGGHEEKTFTGDLDSVLRKQLEVPHFDILGRLINAIPRTHDVIEIIATASSIPEEMEAIYTAAYKGAGYNHVGIIRIGDKVAANDPQWVTRIHYAHAVFFTGGDQRKLASVLKDSDVLAAIKKKYWADPHFIVAGTSAGAMSLPDIIIERGIIQEALLKNDLITGTGFGFIEGIIVDTHFIKRGRFGRLAHAVALYAPKNTGVGLGEDGALLITNGNEAECLGSGMVIVIDGSGIGATNINEVDNNDLIAIENLKVHILSEGCKYLIREKQFVLGSPSGKDIIE